MEPPASKYVKEFCARVKRLRNRPGCRKHRWRLHSRGFNTPTRNMKPERYAHRLIPRFVAIVKVDIDYLVTGLHSPGNQKVAGLTPEPLIYSVARMRISIRHQLTGFCDEPGTRRLILVRPSPRGVPTGWG